jgi:hypothetical protein
MHNESIGGCVMREGFLDFYRRKWPRIAAVQAMALGGASLLAELRPRVWWPDLRW